MIRIAQDPPGFHRFPGEMACTHMGEAVGRGPPRAVFARGARPTKTWQEPGLAWHSTNCFDERNESMKFQTKLSEEPDEAKTFELVPPGIYRAKVFGVIPSKASTGTQYLNVEFEILGPSHEGRHSWGNIYLTGKAGWKMRALCHAVGLEPSDEMDTRDFLGKELLIVVKEAPDQFGNLRTEVLGFRRLRGRDIPF